MRKLRSLRGAELVEGDLPLALVADIDDRVILTDGDYRAAEDFTLLDAAAGVDAGHDHRPGSIIGLDPQLPRQRHAPKARQSDLEMNEQLRAEPLEQIDPRIRSRMLDKRLCRIYALTVPSYTGAAPVKSKTQRRVATK